MRWSCNFCIENADKYGLDDTGMPLEQLDDNGSHGLPKGEKPLVLDIGKYDYKKCDDISNTKG